MANNALFMETDLREASEPSQPGQGAGKKTTSSPATQSNPIILSPTTMDGTSPSQAGSSAGSADGKDVASTPILTDDTVIDGRMHSGSPEMKESARQSTSGMPGPSGMQAAKKVNY